MGIMRSSNWVEIATAATAVAAAVYHLVNTQIMIVDPLHHKSVHFGFILALVFLFSLKTVKNKMSQFLYIVCLTLSVAFAVYVFYQTDFLCIQPGTLRISDLIIGITLTFLILFANFKAFGLALSLLTFIFIMYTFLGNYLPGLLQAPQAELEFAISRFGMGMTTGFLGPLIDVSANFIFLYVLFGAMISGSGAQQFFIQASRWFSGRLRSGPAFAAIFTSCLFGSCTASVTSNVATTGSFTIPIMKKMGYAPHQAGAIEAMASSGGQIMPPIMSSAVFLMADFTGIPYLKILAACLIPALLYYYTGCVYVQLQAVKLNLHSIKQEVDVRRLAITAPLFIVPLGLLVVLLVVRYSPMFAITWSIISLFIVNIGMGLAVKELRIPLNKWVENLTNGAVLGAKIGVSVCCLGIIEIVFSYTMLGIKFPVLVETVSGGIIPIVLIFTAIASIILSCGGLPALSIYVIVAMVIAPVLVRAGFPLLQSHLFPFYYGAMAFITPPIAVGALVASAIAGSTYMKTAVEATKVGVGGFMVPFLFILCPTLTLQAQTKSQAITEIALCLLILLNIEIALVGQFLTRLKLSIRLLFIGVSALLILYLVNGKSSWLIAGLGLFFILSFWEWQQKNKVHNME